MATKDKVQKIKGVTPRGVFRWPNLLKPDFGTEKHPKADGEYNVRLALPQAEAEAFVEKHLADVIETARQNAEEAFAKMSVASRKKLGGVKENPIFTEIYDRETEEPTGDVEFRFAMKASGVNTKKEKWERKPVIFDGKGKPTTKLKAIWGGTIGKVSWEASPYFVEGSGAYGVKLYLVAVQVIELNQGGGRSASDFGFGAEEDGYDSSEDSMGFDEEEGGYSAEAGSEDDDDSDPSKDF